MESRLGEGILRQFYLFKRLKLVAEVLSLRLEQLPDSRAVLDQAWTTLRAPTDVRPRSVLHTSSRYMTGLLGELHSQCTEIESEV